ncbi:MAG: response regulator [Ignavibacteriae bacterium]|nr:response regulator [Ignavibacteriota bacterium]
MIKKILVIDDAEYILESTSTLLRFEGYDVFTASDGLTGVEIASNVIPDLILCDISMPGLDGYGVLEKVRNLPNTTTTPFIFLTALTEKKNMRTGMEKGADDYIVKPYTRNELIAAIDAQWKRHTLIEKHVQEKVDKVGKSVIYALPHEFRTVLNEVINSARYINNSADTVKPKEVRELAGDIISSAMRLMKITENFLFYVSLESIMSNPQKKNMLRTFSTVEPVAIAEDIAHLIADKYERSADLYFLNNVTGIRAQISTESYHKIIDELIDNALRFSEKDSKIFVNSWIEDNLLFISIKDNGRGMTQEQISSISALSQFDRSIYEQQGVGLGLVISKKLVELHDGSFKIESGLQNGTEVIFSLHFEKAN